MDDNACTLCMIFFATLIQKQQPLLICPKYYQLCNVYVKCILLVSFNTVDLHYDYYIDTTLSGFIVGIVPQYFYVFHTVVAIIRLILM